MLSLSSVNANIPPLDEGKANWLLLAVSTSSGAIRIIKDIAPSTGCETVAANPLKDAQRSHPSDLDKDSEEYRKAVKDFFELSVKPPTASTRSRSSKPTDPYYLWLRSYSLYDASPVSSNKDTIRYLDHLWTCKNRPTIAMYDGQVTEVRVNHVNNQTTILSQYIEPIIPVIIEKDVAQKTIVELHETYNDVCKAVAEIELSASTLRTNSRALTLAKNLVGDGAFGIFEVLSDSSPLPKFNFFSSRRDKEKHAKWYVAMREKWRHLFDKALWTKDDLFRRHGHVTSRRRDRVQNWEESGGFDPKGTRAATWKRNMKEEMERAFTDRWEHLERDLRAASEDFKRDIESIQAQGHDLFESMKSDPDEFVSGLWHYHCENRTWWRKYEEWEGRREERMRMVETFMQTSIDLMNELRKIDGSASAKDLNVVMPEEEDWYLLQRCLLHIKIEVGFQAHERQLISLCNDLFTLMEKRLRSKALNQGFQTLIKKQDHFRNTFMDFATVAIFFSSITATTLQFSFDAGDENNSSTIVNVCWFASLVLSVASATNSFLGAIVHQSPEYLRPSANPNHHFLQNWFKFVPPALLSVSGMMFLMGICAFTFMSTTTTPNQGALIKTTTIGLTSTNVISLLIVVLLAFTRTLQLAVSATYIALFFSRFIAEIIVLSGGALLISALGILHVVDGLIRRRRFTRGRESWFQTIIKKTQAVLEPVARWCMSDWNILLSNHRAMKRNITSIVRPHWAKVQLLFNEWKAHHEPLPSFAFSDRPPSPVTFRHSPESNR